MTSVRDLDRRLAPLLEPEEHGPPPRATDLTVERVPPALRVLAFGVVVAGTVAVWVFTIWVIAVEVLNG